MTRANREVCLNMSANFAAAIDAFFSTSMNEAALAPLSTCADRRVQLPPLEILSQIDNVFETHSEHLWSSGYDVSLTR